MENNREHLVYGIFRNILKTHDYKSLHEILAKCNLTNDELKYLVELMANKINIDFSNSLIEKYIKLSEQ